MVSARISNRETLQKFAFILGGFFIIAGIMLSIFMNSNSIPLAFFMSGALVAGITMACDIICPF
jgi:hypothetical protein